MIKLLPFILIPLLIVGGLWFWRYNSSKQSLTTPQVSSEPVKQEELAVEVPKTLPGATLDDRVKSLEETIIKLVAQVNSLKSVGPAASNLTSVESAIVELKARVSGLEKVAPVPVQSSTKSTVYIPLGSGGGPWGATDWISLNEYEISLNTDNYPGYTGMNLEATFRLVEAAGTGSIRLYNITDSSATSSQLDTTSTTFSLQTSSSFKLASGTKTYKLQVKSNQGKDLFIQSVRIKVSF